MYISNYSWVVSCACVRCELSRPKLDVTDFVAVTAAAGECYCSGRCCSLAGAAASIDVSNPQTDPRCVLVTNVQSALGLQQGVDSKTWKIINPCILIFTLVLLRVLVYVALRRKTSRV